MNITLERIVAQNARNLFSDKNSISKHTCDISIVMEVSQSVMNKICEDDINFCSRPLVLSISTVARLILRLNIP